MEIKERVVRFLRWTEKFTETDMIYATKGSFWIIFGRVGLFLIAFLKMLVFGHWLDQGTYGIYSFIISMAGILAIFTLPGLGTSLIKAIAKKKDGTFPLAVKESIKYSLLGSLASLVAASWYLYNQNIELATAFLIIAIFLPFQGSFGLFATFWIARKDFERQNKYSLIIAIFSALATIPVIILTNNPVWIVLALFIFNSIFNGIFFFKTLKKKENNDIMPEAISFGKNLTIMGAIGHFAAHLDKIILWKFFGPVQLAIYSFALIPIQQIQGIIPISLLALPKIGEKGITTKMKKGLMKKFKKLFLISIPMAVVTFLAAPYFYKIILPQYIESIPYFQAFSFLIILSPFALLGSALIAEMKKREIYIIQITIPVLKILLFLVLIPFWGIWGVIAAIIIAQTIEGFFSLYFFLKINSS